MSAAKPTRFALYTALLSAMCIAFHTSAETLSEIYEQSLQNDPQLRADRAAYLAGQESKNIGRASLLPVISAVGEYSETDSEDSSRTVFTQTTGSGREGDTEVDSEHYSLSLTQPLFDLSAWFGFQQGKQLSLQAQAQFGADQQAMILRVTEAYFNVLRAQENLSTAQAEETAIQRQLEQTRERFEVGLLPITDVHEAQATFDDATVNTLEARGALDIAFEALSVLTGQSHTQLAGLVDNFPVAKPDPVNSEDWVQFSLQNNFSLQSARFAREAAQQNAKSKKSEHLPTLTGSLSYYNNHSDSEFNGLDGNGNPLNSPSFSDQDGHTAALRLEIPLFTGGLTSAQRRQAYQQFIQAQENFIASQRNTVQQARSQHLQVVTDSARVKARKQSITSAQSALEATQAGYDVGTRNIVDVLLAQRNLFQAKRNYANARYDYISSLLNLKAVAGQLSPDDIYQLNAWLDPQLQVLRAGAQ
ncbi:MAG: TolC family outer membrane protein [Pseudomonadales bacterium]|nr:TolC family outer membrane protein [Pseudomonadales bacterium]